MHIDFSSFQLMVPTQVPEQSPHHKMKRVNTPSKTVKQQLFSVVEIGRLGIFLHIGQ